MIALPGTTVASPSLKSGIYAGIVRHRRALPRRHSFRMPLYMMFLDLEELERVFSLSPVYGLDHPAIASFRREDYLGDVRQPIRDAVQDLVEARLGRGLSGPVRLLTHLRYLGYCFNPVSFYYCYKADGRTLDVIVAEITNTPWKERHAYVLDCREGEMRGAPHRFAFEKRFHVSPFMPMGLGYDWRFGVPGARLGVHMRLMDDRGDTPTEVFDATLALRRVPITPASLREVLVRYPAMTMVVGAQIHLHAFRLWLKRIPIQPHPRRRGLSNPVPMEGIRS